MKLPDKKEQLPVPRMDPDIKAMNGKSTKRLQKCLDELTDLLDAPETQHEESSHHDDTTSCPDAE